MPTRGTKSSYEFRTIGLCSVLELTFGVDSSTIAGVWNTQSVAHLERKLCSAFATRRAIMMGPCGLLIVIARVEFEISLNHGKVMSTR